MLTTETQAIVDEQEQLRIHKSTADTIPNRLFQSEETGANKKVDSSWIERAMSIEWLGQTIASLCWIVSVFCYGITSVGDCLQLAAASAWLVANIASIARP